ncbi:hypothetical protein EMWEY_00058990 [Eimeria maxima]|uniref:Uncharacterized protein n=1 Tax=Eimeria maxima TaxID=5804 RepID=U6M172_EIMMA|nr:hypothetical protein EMWEY_00058990 [Eimeria maxima]CDJ56838.1 hypothetical protein EMWEY_00058990 [Eimeria maxima]
MARVKSIGQVKPQPQEEEAAAAAAAAAAGAAAGAAGAGAAANPPDTAADAAEEEPKIDEEGVDSEGDGDLFGDDDQGYIYNNELEEEIAQNDEFNQEIQENELEQEIALEGAAATATGEEGDEELNII